MSVGTKSVVQCYPLFHGPGLSSKLADAEVILGLILTGFITLGVVIGSATFALQLMLYSRPLPPHWWWAWVVPIALVIIVMQAKTLQMALSIEGLPYPRPVGLALRQPNWPVGLKPLAALWWLIQFGLILAAGHGIVEGMNFPRLSLGEDIITSSLQVIVLFMAAYGSTCFLLFALAVFSRSEAWLLRAWKLRGVFDLIIALSAFLIARGSS